MSEKADSCSLFCSSNQETLEHSRKLHIKYDKDSYGELGGRMFATNISNRLTIQWHNDSNETVTTTVTTTTSITVTTTNTISATKPTPITNSNSSITSNRSTQLPFSISRQKHEKY